jgi:hypothetical protein
VENTRAKMTDDFIVNWLPRLHEFMGDVVSLNEVGTARRQHLAHHRLPARNSACKADS